MVLCSNTLDLIFVSIGFTICWFTSKEIMETPEDDPINMALEHKGYLLWKTRDNVSDYCKYFNMNTNLDKLFEKEIKTQVPDLASRSQHVLSRLQNANHTGTTMMESLRLVLKKAKATWASIDLRDCRESPGQIACDWFFWQSKAENVFANVRATEDRCILG